MCGIAGIFRRREPDGEDPARLAGMAGRLRHRGPDDFGYAHLNSRAAGRGAQLPDVLLANRRLSILDLSPSGRQPMRNETGDIVLVFNGEIFNYLELRRELAAHHVFASHTDTEVILHAYEEWGRDCVNRFNGMWAFALWDERRQELFCSRDRFGIKPFYYFLDEAIFAFASEVKALLLAVPGRPRPDYGVLSDYLIDGCANRTSETCFEGIRRLEPAHNLVVSRSKTEIARYWDYPHGEAPAADPVGAFRELLEDAVRLRLRSDVPVGIALSGGLDSTSTLALARKFQDSGELRAYSVTFPGEPFDESKWAKLAAERYECDLTLVEYEPRDFVAEVSDAIWMLDYPAADTQIMPRARLMQVAGRDVRVILEGQGADELLGGYVSRYFPPYFLDEFRARANHREGRLGGLLQELRQAYRRYPRRTCEGFFRELAPGFLPARRLRLVWDANTCFTKEFLREACGRRYPDFPRHFHGRLNHLLHFDHATGILPQLLKFGDSLSMAASVESRLPFLDYRLVEFVSRLEQGHKLQGLVSKGILRAALGDVLPEEILNRRDKVGFTTPTSRWISDSMDSSIRPLLLSRRCLERGIFDRQKIEKVLARHRRTRGSEAMVIFRWLCTELWLRRFIDDGGTVEQPTPTASVGAAATAFRSGFGN
ncbi:MAG: asparagine synthase (glutamine-hydrolyzing) [Bryobacteraceae bacterium]|nr:asparagine synthase (glutamine-hydrolyzing) [Bryobacteraceae bacterium]